MKSIEDLKKNIEECTGYTCKHETLERHYIIEEKDILDIYGAGREYGEKLILRRFISEMEKLEIHAGDELVLYRRILEIIKK